MYTLCNVYKHLNKLQNLNGIVVKHLEAMSFQLNIISVWWYLYLCLCLHHLLLLYLIGTLLYNLRVTYKYNIYTYTSDK